MDLTFANPLGAWALLGIPVILLIHCFQNKTRRLEISTLFLLEQVTRESERGGAFERLRHSPLLWLQLLAVALLSFLLARPMWLRADSVQPVAIVLDSSVSMQAFLDEARSGIARAARQLEKTAKKCAWTVIESDTARRQVYSGDQTDELLKAIDAWQPRTGQHDIQSALRIAQGVAGPQGVVVYVTDRVPEALPPGVDLVAVGHPVANAGFAGVRVNVETNETVWHALAMNYSDEPQRRSYHLEIGTERTSAMQLDLAPRGVHSLRGVFPPGQKKLRIVMDADAFPLDDVLPLVVPQTKELTFELHTHKDLDPLIKKITTAESQLARDTSGRPDFAFTSSPYTRNRGLVFLHEEESTAKLFSGPIVAERHPLMTGLNWQGLLARATTTFATTNTDEVLLWQGGRPLILLRNAEGARKLLFNFDVMHSNAERLPAFALLVHRFIESLRSETVAFERRNVELNQTLDIAASGPIALDGTTPVASPFNAPDTPGFFAVQQDRKLLLEGATHFADVREGNFRDAVSKDNIQERSRVLARVNSRDDFLTPVWLVLLGGILLASWAVAERRAG